MAVYYHFAPILLAPGTIIEPGNFGRQIRLFGPAHDLFMRESAYENVRADMFPERPSRLNCLFAFPTLNEAEVYRSRYGVFRDILYEIRNDESNPHIADLHALQQPGHPNFAGIVHYYWEGWRESGIPFTDTFREVLLRSSACVVQRI